MRQGLRTHINIMESMDTTVATHIIAATAKEIGEATVEAVSTGI